jgi:cob(I)alamin adenosyltransferase
MLERGFVQIYTGDGKGKTTAALGLALRAAGCGNKVLIYQFLKPRSLQINERTALKNVSGITVEILDVPWDMAKSPYDEKAVKQAASAIHDALEKIV